MREAAHHSVRRYPLTLDAEVTGEAMSRSLCHLPQSECERVIEHAIDCSDYHKETVWRSLFYYCQSRLKKAQDAFKRKAA